jgi:signal transduction histidine kinase/DNA-binding response OmpR family regulator
MGDRSDVSQNAAFTARALAHAPDAILALSTVGTVTAYHRGAADDGVMMQAPEGAALTAILPPRAAQVLRSGMAEALASGSTITAVYPLSQTPGQGARSDDGPAHPRYIEARIVPDGEERVLCYLRDITDQRLAEQSLIRRDLMYGALTQIYHRLLMASPDDAAVTADVLAMLGYAAGARVAAYVDGKRGDLTRPDDAVGLIWQGEAARGAPPIGPGRRLARLPLARWLPKLRGGRPVQSSVGQVADRSGAVGEQTICLLIPILTQEELVGLLVFERRRGEGRWPSEEVDLLRAAANAIAFHVERLSYVAQLEANAEEIAQMNADLASARDRARASDRAKSEFLSVVGHELRTPLNPIISMTEMLLGCRLTAEQREYAELAHEAALTLLQQINAILDYIDIETGGLVLRRLAVDPAAQVERVGDLMKARAQGKALSLMTFCHPETPPQVIGDPDCIQKVLEKLVDNAFKFTDQGEVIVRVAPVPSPSRADRLVLQFSVSDTGVGLERDAESWLFTPFTQADGTSTRAYGGTGLGLATAKRWVEAMGGDIGVRPNVPGGAVFWFRLPFELPSEDGTPDGLSDPAGDPSGVHAVREVKGRLDGLRILVVDDLESNRDILTSYLRRWRAACTTTGDPREALRLLAQARQAQQPYHVAVLDLMMPEIDGLALAAAIQQREISPGTRLILVTGYDAPGQDALARHSGFSGYLTKPLHRAALYDMLVHVMATADVPAGFPSGDDDAEAALGANPGAAAGANPGAAAGANPGAAAGANPGAAAGANPGTGASDGGAAVALLVEGNTILRRLGARDLTQAGFDVIAVAGDAEALRALAEASRVDVALIDLQGEDRALAAAVRAYRTAHPDGPLAVVGMATQQGAAARDRCAAAGLDGCMPKPLTPAAIQRLRARWGGGR